MRKEHKTKVLKEVEITDSEVIICDCCKKVIFDKDNIDEFIKGRYNKIKYYIAYTGHNDWGNDSIESFVNYDLCSDECLKNKFDEFIEENKGSYTGFFKIFTNSIFIDGDTKEFDIEENIYL